MRELRQSTDGNFYEVTDKEIELATKLHDMWEDYLDDIDENAMRLAIYRDECTAAIRAQLAERDSAIDSLRETIAKQTQTYDTLRAQVEQKNKALDKAEQWFTEYTERHNVKGDRTRQFAIWIEL